MWGLPILTNTTSLLKELYQLPKYGYDFLKTNYTTKKYEQNSTFRWNGLFFTKETIEQLFLKLKYSKHSPVALTQLDQVLLNEIKKKTQQNNRNNVTRTNAYFQFYEKHPEIHWALLAHFVSRNGGWNMTDLKGSIVNPLLSSTSRNHFFSFLERANVLIFHDAYPQLLLYEASKKQKKNLFYLLPKLGVSRFMRPFWDNFLQTYDSQLLTVALIINEQNYIEQRIIQQPYFKKNVLDTLLFELQEYLQLTYVLFPYMQKQDIQLAGLQVNNFSGLKARVEIGKKLYVTLFGIENLLSDCLQFARNHNHTGSRADYWPNLFTNNPNQSLVNSVSCKPKSPSIYSPSLLDAWSEVRHTFTDTRDWFETDKNLFHEYFTPIETAKTFEMTVRYCRAIAKMVSASSFITTISKS